MKKQPSVKTLQNTIAQISQELGIKNRRIMELESAQRHDHNLLKEITTMNETYISKVNRENMELRNTIRTMASVLHTPLLRIQHGSTGADTYLEPKPMKMPFAA